MTLFASSQHTNPSVLPWSVQIMHFCIFCSFMFISFERVRFQKDISTEIELLDLHGENRFLKKSYFPACFMMKYQSMWFEILTLNFQNFQKKHSPALPVFFAISKQKNVAKKIITATSRSLILSHSYFFELQSVQYYTSTKTF